MKVLYVDAENGEREIHRRVHGLGLKPNVASQLSVYSAEGFDLRRNLADLGQILAIEEPEVLILDSFRSLWAGDENDSGEVASVLDPLRNLVRKHNTATLLLHHSPKGAKDYRGSGAIGASAELIFVLARHDDDPEPDRRYLECRKCRPAPEPQTRWLRLSADMGMVLIDETEPYVGDENEDERPRPRRQALSAQVEDVLLSAMSAGLPLTRAEIARRCGRHPKDGSVGRVLDALVKSASARRDESGGYFAALLSEGATVPSPYGHGTLAPREPDAEGDSIATANGGASNQLFETPETRTHPGAYQEPTQ